MRRPPASARVSWGAETGVSFAHDSTRWEPPRPRRDRGARLLQPEREHSHDAALARPLRRLAAHHDDDAALEPDGPRRRRPRQQRPGAHLGDERAGRAAGRGLPDREGPDGAARAHSPQGRGQDGGDPRGHAAEPHRRGHRDADDRPGAGGAGDVRRAAGGLGGEGGSRRLRRRHLAVQRAAADGRRVAAEVDDRYPEVGVRAVDGGRLRRDRALRGVEPRLHGRRGDRGHAVRPGGARAVRVDEPGGLPRRHDAVRAARSDAVDARGFPGRPDARDGAAAAREAADAARGRRTCCRRRTAS